jgi:hypothetical protein
MPVWTYNREMFQSEQERCASFARREDDALSYCDRLIIFYSNIKQGHDRWLTIYRTASLVFPALAAVLSAIPLVAHFAAWTITIAAILTVLSVGFLLMTDHDAESRMLAAKIAQLSSEKMLYTQRSREYANSEDSEGPLELFTRRVVSIHASRPPLMTNPFE